MTVLSSWLDLEHNGFAHGQHCALCTPCPLCCAQAFLDAAKPVTAVVLAHNGMNRALQHIQAFHPRLHFAALSPHVAAAARHALHIHTHWLLPTFTFTFTGKVSSATE